MKALNNLVSAGGYLIGVEALLIGQRPGKEILPQVAADAAQCLGVVTAVFAIRRNKACGDALKV